MTQLFQPIAVFHVNLVVPGSGRDENALAFPRLPATNHHNGSRQGGEADFKGA
ncbi:hypothetical protein [Micromonospora sp. NPDC004551]|uniref:hypothetical protein n=1 Tax=Micromonospora sp. NPDC004551 TaxID=3154284 RepID=UPI0033A063FB